MKMSRMRNQQCRLLILSNLLLVSASFALSKLDFNRYILPLLSEKCFACHGPDARKVKGGLRLDLRSVATKPANSGKIAIIPGKPAESDLVRRIFTEDTDDLMPPRASHKTLTTTQKEMLKR